MKLNKNTSLATFNKLVKEPISIMDNFMHQVALSQGKLLLS